MRLLLVRHGRTAWNAAGRYQGHADPPLDDVGDAQAAEVAVALAPLRPDLVVTSDLRRAVDTARPLVVAAGAPTCTDVRLREVDLGTWEGLTRVEAAARHPAEMVAWEAGGDVARGGGETPAAAGRRAAEAIVGHLSGFEAATVVVVSHGLVLRSAARRLADLGVVAMEEEPPHLTNGRWMDLQVDRSALRAAAGRHHPGVGAP